MLPIHYHGPLITRRDLKQQLLLRLDDIEEWKRLFRETEKEYERLFFSVESLSMLSDAQLDHLIYLKITLKRLRARVICMFRACTKVDTKLRNNKRERTQDEDDSDYVE